MNEAGPHAETTKERFTVASYEDAVSYMLRNEIFFPVYVIPFGENSGADFYEVYDTSQLKIAVRKALDASLYEKRAHIVNAPTKQDMIVHPSESFIK